MPRASLAKGRVLGDKTLVVDNGGYSIKAGFVSSDPSYEECHIIPNCIARDRAKRVWVGSQLDRVTDFGEIALRRPIEKGFIVNWEAEKAIWDATFVDKGARLQCDPHETNLVLAEAPNTPTALQTNCDQIVFEEYEFASYSRSAGPTLNAYNDIRGIFHDPATSTDTPIQPSECLLVIDSGFSHTTVTPLYHGKPIQQGLRRLDVGGKFLTNYLKELVSIRHYNMVDETYLINDIKESVCFVSSDFKRDLERVWKGTSEARRAPRPGEKDIVIDYVLPDYSSHKKGHVRPRDPSLNAKLKKIGMAIPGEANEDFMTLDNERFSVPELLFTPRDVGLRQPGIAEIAMQSLSAVPTGLWPAMLANVLVVGGNAQIEGFMARIEAEIRQLAPAECVLRVQKAPDSVKSTWLGGARMAMNKTRLNSLQVTRQEYQEHGSGWTARYFQGAVTR